MLDKSKIQHYYKGVSYIPVFKNTKIPQDKYWQYKKYGINDINSDDNIAALCGTEVFKNRFLVIYDVDFNIKTKQGQNVFNIISKICNDTLIVKSGGKHNGLHVYYLTNVPVASSSILTPYGMIEIKAVAPNGRPDPMMLPPSVVLKKYEVIHPVRAEYVDFNRVKQLSFTEFKQKTANIKEQLKNI